MSYLPQQNGGQPQPELAAGEPAPRPRLRKITREESVAYLNGWAAYHRGLPSVEPPRERDREVHAYRRGRFHCASARIDADWALGPDKLPDGATTEEP